jgi:ABC-type transporter Mla subunit MlaD
MEKSSLAAGLWGSLIGTTGSRALPGGIIANVSMVHAMRKVFIALVVCFGLLSVWLAFRKTPTHQLNVRTYFQNAQSLQRGTPVWIDGVQAGSVTDVRIRPEPSERPVEVLMAITTTYELSIPRDSRATLSAQGVLGPTVVEINTRMASGSPLENGGVLKSMEGTVTGNQAADVTEKIGNVLIEESKRLREQDKPPGAPATK